MGPYREPVSTYNLRVNQSTKGRVKGLCSCYNKKILTAFLIACRACVILASAQYFLSENYSRLL